MFVRNRLIVARVLRVSVLIFALFGFFVALAIRVKQKNSSAVVSKVYLLLGGALGAHLTSDRRALQRTTLNSIGNELSAFCSQCNPRRK